MSRALGIYRFKFKFELLVPAIENILADRANERELCLLFGILSNIDFLEVTDLFEIYEDYYTLLM